MTNTFGFPLDIQVKNTTATLFYKPKDKTNTKTRVYPFRPILYFLPREKSEFSAWEKSLEEHEKVVEISVVKKRAFIQENTLRRVISIVALGTKGLQQLVEDLAPFGRLFNTDLDLSQRFFLERGIFPGLLSLDPLHNVEELKAFDYYIPELQIAKLSIETDHPLGLITPQVRLKKAVLKFSDETIVLDQEEESILFGIDEVFREKDPDVVITRYGDEYVFPFLAHRARLLDMLDKLRFGRTNEPPRYARMGEKGTSFLSYGQRYYRSKPYYLPGRIHIDLANSFFFRDAGIIGLIEVSRLSGYPVQKVSRSTIGKALTGVEITTAFAHNVLIEQEKASPELIKPAEYLLRADSGGLIYSPRPGLYQGIVGVDFTSYYPYLMKEYNISSETVLCRCCDPSRDNVGVVPYVGYHICAKKRGLIPLSLDHLLERRVHFKKLKQSSQNPIQQKQASQKDSAIKWMLVTCFGYLGFKNSKWGSIESHQAVTAYGRYYLHKATKIFEKHGWEIVAGLTDSLWIRRKGKNETATNLIGEMGSVQQVLEPVLREIQTETRVPIQYEGIYDWIVFLPLKSHREVGALTRYYGKFHNGTLKVRGIELRRRDTPPLIKQFQEEALDVLSQATNAVEFLELVPKVKTLLLSWKSKIAREEVEIENLYHTQKIGKKHYRVCSKQSSAKLQLEEIGVHVLPGESVKYVVTNDSTNNPWRKVLIAPLHKKGVIPFDREYYDQLLNRAFESLFSFLHP